MVGPGGQTFIKLSMKLPENGMGYFLLRRMGFGTLEFFKQKRNDQRKEYYKDYS